MKKLLCSAMVLLGAMASSQQAPASCVPNELNSIGVANGATSDASAKSRGIPLSVYLGQRSPAATTALKADARQTPALAPDPGSVNFEPCLNGGQWVIYEINALERVRIEGPAVEDPITYEAIASYNFNRQLAINSNTPPDNSPSDPPPNQTLSKEERCENKRRQCVQDALEISKRLEEGANSKFPEIPSQFQS